MLIGLPKESRTNETRVALTPDAVKKLLAKGYTIPAESGCGLRSGFPDQLYPQNVEWSSPQQVCSADVIFKVNRPTIDEISLFKKNSVLLTQIEPFVKDDVINKLASQGVTTLGIEYLPRIARTQSMDVLSSQANITGYRSVIEATNRFGRFFPMLMTAAGSTKPAKVMILGVGVAGLQAIATARRLGAQVEAYDVRPEVKEQIQSLGAKPVELDIGEDGSGQGGYAKELSQSAKERQQSLLEDKLIDCDVIITTANIPGRRAPILISETTVKKLRPGSVIIDLAAATGGNCPLTKPDEVINHNDVVIVGFTNYPAMMPADASNFYANNLCAILDIFVRKEQDKFELNIDTNDEIIKALLVTHLGKNLKEDKA